MLPEPLDRFGQPLLKTDLRLVLEKLFGPGDVGQCPPGLPGDGRKMPRGDLLAHQAVEDRDEVEDRVLPAIPHIEDVWPNVRRIEGLPRGVNHIVNTGEIPALTAIAEDRRGQIIQQAGNETRDGPGIL